MSADKLYRSRLALIGEARELRAEQTALGPRLIEAGTRQREAATQLQNCTARTRGDREDAEQQVRQVEADSSDEALHTLRTRGEAIRARLAEIEHEVHLPIALTDKDIRGHLKALDAARQAVAKLEAVVSTQAELVDSLGNGPDARLDLAARRADLLARIALGEGTTDDLARFDEASAPKLREADALSERREEANAVSAVLAARLVAAQQAVDDLHPLSRLCAESIVASELASASQAWQSIAAQEIQARNALAGLDQVFRSLGGAPPARPSFEPLTITQAAASELERLRSAHPDLF
ncbi:hypothetical protein [Thiocystis violacea]|uniref:hypothetical protein n=1 Tax=Thiocystis violacea TaxID=13725 RepID=UPI001907C2E7|nr:hypothetical protein [Thiocystis violacea]MBK1716848.1 hypothetical protein [Thiocystis violacea]